MKSLMTKLTILFLFIIGVFATANSAQAQYSRICSPLNVAYGQPLPTPSQTLFDQQAACEAYKSANCIADGKAVGPGGWCCSDKFYQTTNSVMCGVGPSNLINPGTICTLATGCVCKDTGRSAQNTWTCPKQVVILAGATCTGGDITCLCNGVTISPGTKCTTTATPVPTPKPIASGVTCVSATTCKCPNGSIVPNGVPCPGACVADGAVLGQGAHCCNSTNTYYQKGNLLYCGKSPVTVTSCKVGGNTLSAGGTACKSNGDSVEYVCVANGSNVGNAPDDTGANVLQSRSCGLGYFCNGNACALYQSTTKVNDACSLPHGQIDPKANMYCCTGRYSATACGGAQGYYLFGSDLVDGTWCKPGSSDLISGSGGCNRCAIPATKRADGKWYCGSVPTLYCDKICPVDTFCKPNGTGGQCSVVKKYIPDGRLNLGKGQLCIFSSTCTCTLSTGESYTIKNDGTICGMKAVAGTVPTISLGEVCNSPSGCSCNVGNSTNLIGTRIEKFDVCGKSPTTVSRKTCSGQCISTSSNATCTTAGEQKGVGVCPVGFGCCTQLLDPKQNLTLLEKQCISRFNSTGLIIQDPACEKTLVNKGIVTLNQLSQTKAQQIMTDLSLQSVAGMATRIVAINNRSDALNKAYLEGKITLAEYLAQQSIVIADLATLGGVDTTLNSFKFTREQCLSNPDPVACAAHTLGALANLGLLTLNVDSILGSPIQNALSTLVSLNTVTGISAIDATNEATNAVLIKLLNSGKALDQSGVGGVVLMDGAIARELAENGYVTLADGYLLDPGIIDKASSRAYFNRISSWSDGAILTDNLEDAVQALNSPGGLKLLSIDAHGNSEIIVLNGTRIGPRAFADALKQAGLPDACLIHLISCETGLGFARKLANKLSELGYTDVTVRAPIGFAKIYENSELIVFPPYQNSNPYPGLTGWVDYKTVVGGIPAP